jgi:serine phosphatase RsbU (regulator of sigma subunit)
MPTHRFNIHRALFLVFYYFLLQISSLATGQNAQNGFLELTSNDFNEHKPVKLRGEWDLYWQQLLTPENIDMVGTKTGSMQVPGKWNTVKADGKSLPGKGFATLKLDFTAHPAENIALDIVGANSAIKVFFNGQLVAEKGRVGTNPENAKPAFCNILIDNLSMKTHNTLIIQLSNYSLKSGGIEDLRLGSQNELAEYHSTRTRMDFILFGSIFIMAIYHLGLYFIRRKFIAALYFGIFCLLIAFRTLAVGDKNILDVFDIRWSILMKMEYLSYYAAAPAFVFFVYSLFKAKFSKMVLQVFVAISSFFVAMALFLPAHIYTQYLQVFQIVTALTGIYLTYVIIASIKINKSTSIIFLVGWLILFFSIINDIMYYNEMLHLTSNMSSAGLGIFIIFQAYLLATEFSDAVFKSEKLAKKLNYTNRNLSKIVEFRTSELEKQKHELFNQKMEIEEQNKDITDSLNYASRIQTAVLPNNDQFNECFYDFFIYYQPKDIVSGDFYWIKRIRDKILVAAADCTGHGVPGAFMSLLGIAFLNEIVNMIAYRQDKSEHIRPDRILNELRTRIKTALRQTGDLTETFDGIDMALCVIDYVDNKLYYSGANNSLYIVTKKPKIFDPNPLYLEHKKIVITKTDQVCFAEVKANRMPIGTYLSEKPFSCYEFNLDQIDNIYMFSDGYADQLGGENKTKFRLKRFKEVITENALLDMATQHEKLKETMKGWTCPEIGQIDDITVLGIKLHTDREERSFGIF